VFVTWYTVQIRPIGHVISFESIYTMLKSTTFFAKYWGLVVNILNVKPHTFNKKPERKVYNQKSVVKGSHTSKGFQCLPNVSNA